MSHKLSERLVELMELHSIQSDAELARAAGVPASTISRLLNKGNSNPTVSNLIPLARYFHVSLDQLLGIEELSDLKQSTCEQYLTEQVSCRLPVVNLSQVKAYLQENNPVSNKSQVELVSTGYHFKGQEGLAVKVDTDFYAPIYRKGTVLIIDCSLNQANNDIALLFDEKDELTLRQKISEGEQWLFRDINMTSSSKAASYNTNLKCIGVIVETQYWALLPFNLSH